ncbi:MAG: DUF853 family protein [Saprospiraceae bacterium]|nr:DUF853 family protein [Saprospiraceae bacterium]MBP7699460.1 DUF853 family protein [Saprospiraceae bacterium]
MSNQKFLDAIQAGYAFKGTAIDLGTAMLQGECVSGAMVRIPLKTMNRHGLIAGATGSGKTKTLQVLAEQLAAQGTPCLLMDIKGDLSGIAISGTSNPKIMERHAKIGIPYFEKGNTIELMTISDQPGVRLRATITEFGPVLFSKILGLNDTQGGIVAIIFKYCDDKKLPLIDLQDMKRVLQFLTNEGKSEIETTYGAVSSTTVGTILRKIVELEQQGAAIFFGEPSFEVEDFCRMDENGNGVINVIRLTDLQDRPKLFSTFMLQLLAELYATLPEEGDVEQPKLAVFIDEAHLVFNEASEALLQQIETIIKLIRSKGVGIFFITQNPADIPDAVLGQLGLKIQHALRAFTAKDRKAIKLAAENYPISEFYDTENLITELGIGEALVTALSERGTPTPLAHTLLRAPQSRMDVLSEGEINTIVSHSALVRKYSQTIDRESAYELLSQKLAVAQSEEHIKETKKSTSKSAPEEKSIIEQVLTSSTTRSVANTVVREVTRGLLGVLGIGGSRRRKGGLF